MKARSFLTSVAAKPTDAGESGGAFRTRARGCACAAGKVLGELRAAMSMARLWRGPGQAGNRRVGRAKAVRHAMPRRPSAQVGRPRRSSITARRLPCDHASAVPDSPSQPDEPGKRGRLMRCSDMSGVEVKANSKSRASFVANSPKSDLARLSADLVTVAIYRRDLPARR